MVTTYLQVPYWTVWSLKMKPIGFPETSVSNYHSMLRQIPEERTAHLHLSGSLKSRYRPLLSGVLGSLATFYFKINFETESFGYLRWTGKWSVLRLLCYMETTNMHPCSEKMWSRSSSVRSFSWQKRSLTRQFRWFYWFEVESLH